MNSGKPSFPGEEQRTSGGRVSKLPRILIGGALLRWFALTSQEEDVGPWSLTVMAVVLPVLVKAFGGVSFVKD